MHSVRSDEAFLTSVTAALAGLPGVRAVALGGSRANDQADTDADWDLAIYYRGAFDPASLRALGWPGEVGEIGGWGGGVFNGGAWLTIDDRHVDVHYRDLAAVEREIARAEAGEVVIEPLLFHLAGIPTYLILAELAQARVLSGSLPTVAYPAALRRPAHDAWWGRAEATLRYAAAQATYPQRRPLMVGLAAQGLHMAAHAIAAARGVWVTNEKRLLQQAGLADLVGLFAADAASRLDPSWLLGECRARSTSALGEI